jgi:SagB-type dehydrogenase family enzyme
VRRTVPAYLAARLRGDVALDAQASGELLAYADGYPVSMGRFSTRAAERARELRKGLSFASFSGSSRKIEKELSLLVRRLAESGFLVYYLSRVGKGEDLVVIEPQVQGYWPCMPQIGAADRLVLSRLAYMRRRGSELVLESPHAGALFKICDSKIASTLAMLSMPRQIKELRRQDDFPGPELLALLLDCGILFKADAGSNGLRIEEGDRNLVFWDFHDLLFHTRSTEGRHANPLGGVYPYAGVLPPLPAVRPSWSGEKIDLTKAQTAPRKAFSPLAKLLRERISTRMFDNVNPITIAELSQFLDGAARVLSVSMTSPDLDDGGHAMRPYPSAGAAYELELYLAAVKCDGLARGFYHYDASTHVLVPIEVQEHDLDALLAGSQYSMGAPAPPQILITIAARFARMSWKYSSIAYSLILKDVGVLTQTLYLMAADMGLGGCALGIANIDLFAKMTGIAFHVEGPVGQFGLGRGAPPLEQGQEAGAK